MVGWCLTVMTLSTQAGRGQNKTYNKTVKQYTKVKKIRSALPPDICGDNLDTNGWCH